MKNFLMIFRNDKGGPQPSPEQLQAMVQLWVDWETNMEKTGNCSRSNPLASNALGMAGRTINAEGTISDGPYAEVKEHVGGYTVVQARDLDHATELAKDCPILKVGGSVEIRDIMVFDFLK